MGGSFFFPTMNHTCNDCTCVLQLMFSREFKETGSICKNCIFKRKEKKNNSKDVCKVQIYALEQQQRCVISWQQKDRNRFSAGPLAYALADPYNE